MESIPNQEINIELPDDIALGCYTNLAIITHSPNEFVFDFVRVMPGLKKAKVQQRIIMTPENAKRFLHALQDNIKKFEEHTTLPLSFTDGSAQA